MFEKKAGVVGKHYFVMVPEVGGSSPSLSQDG